MKQVIYHMEHKSKIRSDINLLIRLSSFVGRSCRSADNACSFEKSFSLYNVVDEHFSFGQQSPKYFLGLLSLPYCTVLFLCLHWSTTTFSSRKPVTKILTNLKLFFVYNPGHSLVIMTNETPVSLLNQICSKNDIVPSYNLIAREGRVHAPVFTYKVELVGINVEGSGQSKKKAKHVAAKLMLKELVKGDSVMLDVLEQAAIQKCLKACDEEDIAEAIKLTNAYQNAIQGQNREAITGPDGRSEDKLGVHDDQSDGLMHAEPTEDLNPIGKLQEICMKKFWNPPVYEDTVIKGEPHERLFYVSIFL